MWGDCSRRSPYHLSGRVGQYHRLAVFLAGVVLPLEDSKGRVAGNGHEAFVVPPFPDLPGHKGMAKVVKVQVRQASIPARCLESGLPSFGHRFAVPGENPPVKMSSVFFYKLDKIAEGE
jgi:hypothetical protein